MVRTNVYKEYRKRYKHKKKRLDRGEFRAAVNLFNKKLIDRIIFDNFEFRITGLGVLSIKKKKVEKFKDGKINTKSLPVDWVKTKKYGKRIYIMNDHTDGYKYFYRFSKINHKNRNYYHFKISRLNSRYLAKILKNQDVYGRVDAYIEN